MQSSKPSFKLLGDVALISIHPVHVEKIVSGKKNLEFRRVWSDRQIDALVVYATHPEQRLAAVVEVVDVVRGSKTALWKVAAAEGGGVTRQELATYLEGKAEGVAIRLGRRVDLGPKVLPTKILGASFRPPQSYRYLTEAEKAKVRKLIGEGR